MKHTAAALKKKVLELFPDLVRQKVAVTVKMNTAKDGYMLRFSRGRDEMLASLDRLDADDCMRNIRSVHLGVKIDQFIAALEAKKEFGRRVA